MDDDGLRKGAWTPEEDAELLRTIGKARRACCSARRHPVVVRGAVALQARYGGESPPGALAALPRQQTCRLPACSPM